MRQCASSVIAASDALKYSDSTLEGRIAREAFAEAESELRASASKHFNSFPRVGIDETGDYESSSLSGSQAKKGKSNVSSFIDLIHLSAVNMLAT